MERARFVHLGREWLLLPRKTSGSQLSVLGVSCPVRVARGVTLLQAASRCRLETEGRKPFAKESRRVQGTRKLAGQVPARWRVLLVCQLELVKEPRHKTRMVDEGRYMMNAS
jgi:hypothetical protein